MNGLIRIPEMFMPDESTTFSFGSIVIFQELIHLPDIFSGTATHQAFVAKARLNALCICPL